MNELNGGPDARRQELLPARPGLCADRHHQHILAGLGASRGKNMTAAPRGKMPTSSAFATPRAS
jgi:hypothetical protein